MHTLNPILKNCRYLSQVKRPGFENQCSQVSSCKIICHSLNKYFLCTYYVPDDALRCDPFLQECSL